MKHQEWSQMEQGIRVALREAKLTYDGSEPIIQVELEQADNCCCFILIEIEEDQRPTAMRVIARVVTSDFVVFASYVNPCFITVFLHRDDPDMFREGLHPRLGEWTERPN